MLTITRKAGESFSIGDDITIHIGRIEGGSVKVSIDAPDDLLILRDNAVGIAPPLLCMEYIGEDG